MNTPVDAVVASLDVDAELGACGIKVESLSAAVQEYEGDYCDTEGQRLVARIWHTYCTWSGSQQARLEMPHNAGSMMRC